MVCLERGREEADSKIGYQIVANYSHLNQHFDLNTASRSRLHEEARQGDHDEARQEDCLDDRSGAGVRDADVALLDERTINHVNYAVGADDVRAEHINFLVVPCYRVTCKWRGKRINKSVTIDARQLKVYNNEMDGSDQCILKLAEFSFEQEASKVC